MPDIIKLKNRYVRQLAGAAFRIVNHEMEEIGRPDFDHRKSLVNAEGRELMVRKVTLLEPWYAEGNVEMMNNGKWEAVPGFGEADSDGHGKYVTPMIDEDTNQIMRTESGRAKTRCTFKWFASFLIETEKPITVTLPKKDETTNDWTDTQVTGTTFRVEFSTGGSGSQYRKLLASIDTFINAAKALGQDVTGVDATNVWVKLSYDAEAKEKASIYTFTPTGLHSAPKTAAPSTQVSQDFNADDIVF